MISPKQFATKWGKDGPLVCFPSESVASLALLDEEKEFLTQAGLPRDAAPFLSFQAPQSGEVPTVAKLWKQPAKFRRYRQIGSDGSGNPIAIDEEGEGAVVLLDHEDKFAATLMNASVRQLAESLLAYRSFVVGLVKKYGEDALLQDELPAKECKKLHAALLKIDSAAMKPGGFWPELTGQSAASDEYPASVLRDLGSPDAKVRFKASKHLESQLRQSRSAQRKEYFGNPQTTTSLIALLSDPDPQIAHNAVVALCQIAAYYYQDERAYAPLLNLVKSKHPLTSRWALGGVIHTGGEKHLDDVLALLKDKNAETREWSLRHLSSWSYNENRTSLAPKNQARLQQAVVGALGDKNPVVRLDSARILGEIGDAKALSGASLKKERDSYAKKSLIESIEKIEARTKK